MKPSTVWATASAKGEGLARQAVRGGARLTPRLLAFNLLLVFLPVAGLFFLGPYERQLLETQERAMVQQGRLLVAGIAASGELTRASARRVVGELAARTDARLRVLDREGRPLADSSLLGPPREPDAAGETRSRARADRRNLLYALGALPFSIWNRIASTPGFPAAEPGEYYSTAERLGGAEVEAALSGRYGAATRIAPGAERAVILYSAIPLRIDGRVAGAVLVSQSTTRILGELYEVRLEIFGVFLASVAAAIALSLYVAGTIARPLVALGAEARAQVDGRGRLRASFRGSSRPDEIGDLARALEELTRQLAARLAATESFAADVSHELKNPLASIRGATEMLAVAKSSEERRRFLAVVEQEIARSERLLASVRDISRLDAPEVAEERTRVDLAALIEQLVESFRRRGERGVEFELRRPPEVVELVGAPERFAAMIENLLDNAASFSPPGAKVEVELTREPGAIRIAVADHGPGVPEAHRERVFDRFFSYRPGVGGQQHSGLGLAIVKAIAETHGGGVAVENRSGGGARFTVRLQTR